MAGWFNVEMFSIMPADRHGLYPVLPDWLGEYECPYILFVPTLLVLPYYVP